VRVQESDDDGRQSASNGPLCYQVAMLFLRIPTLRGKSEMLGMNAAVATEPIIANKNIYCLSSDLLLTACCLLSAD
jgi:hypothetical protein